MSSGVSEALTSAAMRSTPCRDQVAQAAAHGRGGDAQAGGDLGGGQPAVGEQRADQRLVERVESAFHWSPLVAPPRRRGGSLCSVYHTETAESVGEKARWSRCARWARRRREARRREMPRGRRRAAPGARASRSTWPRTAPTSPSAAASAAADAAATCAAIRGLGRRGAAVTRRPRRAGRGRRPRRPAAADALGGLDVLVYAASGPFGRRPPRTSTRRDWQASFDVVAQRLLRRPPAPRVSASLDAATAPRRRGRADAASAVDAGRPDARGVIVALTDVLGTAPSAAFAAHGAAKAAQIMLVASLAKAWAADGVRVCGVAPGPVDLPDDPRREATLRAAARSASGRPVAPADIARAVRFVIACDALTGVNLPVDGGALLSRAAPRSGARRRRAGLAYGWRTAARPLARLGHQLARLEGQPELHAVLRAAEVAAGDVLDALHAIAQRVAVHVEALGGLAPVAVGLEKAGEALDEVARVLLVVLAQLAEHAVVEDLERDRVLQAEQQAVRAQVVEARDDARAALELADLDRVERLVVALAQVDERGGAAGRCRSTP